MKEPLTLTFSHKKRFNKEKCFALKLKSHHNNNFFHLFSSNFPSPRKRFFFFYFDAKKRSICNFCIERCKLRKAEKGTSQKKSINFVARKILYFFFIFRFALLCRNKKETFLLLCSAKGSKNAAGSFSESAKKREKRNFVDKSSSHSRILEKKKA